jgi:ferredoxin
VKLAISPACMGHGLCYSLASELFEDEDDGYGTVRRSGEVPSDQEDLARRAVSNCPEGAISLS